MNTTLFLKLTRSSAGLENSPAPRPAFVAPSLRLRVNAANRALLRWLRAAEMEAWEEPLPPARRTFRLFKR